MWIWGRGKGLGGCFFKNYIIKVLLSCSLISSLLNLFQSRLATWQRKLPCYQIRYLLFLWKSTHIWSSYKPPKTSSIHMLRKDQVWQQILWRSHVCRAYSTDGPRKQEKAGDTCQEPKIKGKDKAIICLKIILLWAFTISGRWHKSTWQIYFSGNHYLSGHGNDASTGLSRSIRECQSSGSVPLRELRAPNWQAEKQ